MMNFFCITKRRGIILRTAVLLALLMGLVTLISHSTSLVPADILQDSACPACERAGQVAMDAEIASQTEARSKLINQSGALPPNPAFDDFNAWVARLEVAAPSARAALEHEGVRLAETRRAALKEMIVSDPDAALARKLSFTQQQALPALVRAKTEERVSVCGTLRLEIAYNPHGPEQQERYVESGDRSWRAFSNAPRFSPWHYNRTVPLHGVAVDDVLALSNDAARMAEPGEIPESTLAELKKTAVCPVSGKPVALLAGAVPALVGSRAVYMCTGGHIELLDEQEFANAVSADADGPIAQSPWTEGVKTFLYIIVKFSDQTNPPETTASAQAKMAEVNAYLQKASFGKTSLAVTVTPVYTLPGTKNDYLTWGGSKLKEDARALAKADTSGSYDTRNYTLEAVRWYGGPGTFAGAAAVGAKGISLKSASARVAAHEIGHNYGLLHAGSWETTDGTTIGAGVLNAYGNYFDIMGDGGVPQGHYNVHAKNLLDWVPDEQIRAITTSGSYRVYAHDLNSLANGRMYGLKVKMDAERDYWLEYRQHPGWSWSGSAKPYLLNSVTLLWSPFVSTGGTQLLDTTPGSAGGKDDAPIALGRTYSDTVHGMHFTVTNRGGTGSDLYADVQVNFGSFPGNRAPTLAINASTLSPALDEVVTFTATASDPENDTLSYFWDFGDKTYGPNGGGCTKSWATAGTRTVTCIASDMKGQTAIQTLSINVMNKPSVAWTAASQSSTGESGTMTVTARLSSASGQNVTVPFNVTGTSTGADRTLSASPITIATGATTGSATITITADTLDEANETVILTLGTPTNATLGAIKVHTATITDDDSAPSVAWTAASQSSTGESGTMTVTARLSSASGQNVTVPFTVTGTSTGADRTLSASPITIATGATTGSATITITADTLDEANETVILTMGTPTNATKGATTVHTATITDDDVNRAPILFSGASATPNPATTNDTVAFSSSASDPDSDTLAYTWDLGDGATAAGATASHKYGVPGVYTVTVTVSDGRGGSITGSVTVTVVTPATPVNLRVNFQLTGSPVPAGYLSDTGAVFGKRGNGQTYGWNVDNSSNARDRNAANSPDHRYDTLLHLQKPQNPNAVWEIAVPNGTYSVRVVVGDPSYFDSIYRLNVEGVLTVNSTPTATAKWFEGTKTVTVSDGHLTVTNAAGSANNKICFIEINNGVTALVLAAEAPEAQPLNVVKLQLTLNFAKPGRDGYRVSGTLPTLVAEFSSSGQVASVDVGAAIAEFTLNEKGRGKNKNGSFTLMRDKKVGWKFAAALKKGAWTELWSDGGLSNVTTTQASEIPVTLTLAGQAYGGSKMLTYKAKELKSASAK